MSVGPSKKQKRLFIDFMWMKHGESALCVLCDGIVFETEGHIFEVFWSDYNPDTLFIFCDPGTDDESRVEITCGNDETAVDIHKKATTFIY